MSDELREIQRQLLMAPPGQRLDGLERCAATAEGRAWCRQRFALHEVLEWMWQEQRGSFELLEVWEPPPDQRDLIQALAPDTYSAQALAQLLFPLPGRYRLQSSGVEGPRSRSLPPELFGVLRRRVREIRPLPRGYRLKERGEALELLPGDEGPRIQLSQLPLQEVDADVLGYGAKDTGEMGGGAAGALLVAAGPELEVAAREQLAQGSRSIGEAHLTPSFGGLRKRGVQWVCHIISIQKHTDQGAWCPHPERLEKGVVRALELAEAREASTLALSALGTNEGRVKADHAATMMVRAARQYFRDHPESSLRVIFSLPNPRDFEAFEKALSS